jgi:hypothetical protein
MFADIYGYQLNKATAQEMLKRTAEMMPMAEIKAGVIASKVVNFDERGNQRKRQIEMAAQCFNRKVDVSICSPETRERSHDG